MFHLTQPAWVRRIGQLYRPIDEIPESVFADIRHKMERFQPEDPVISVVVIAWNEEENLLPTLASLAETESAFPTEILVVNNNSTDRTQEILDRCGVRTIFEDRQGIGWARQAGLEAARGTYFINADADSLYPATWAEAMAEPMMRNTKIVVTYGRYSFIPSEGNNRFALRIHELLTRALLEVRRYQNETANVLGFTFAFRTQEAMAVGGFPVDTKARWEDGMMVHALAPTGKLKLVTTNRARVWTSDRRLQIDGGLWKAFWQRVSKHLYYLPEYLKLRKPTTLRD